MDSFTSWNRFLRHLLIKRYCRTAQCNVFDKGAFNSRSSSKQWFSDRFQLFYLIFQVTGGTHDWIWSRQRYPVHADQSALLNVLVSWLCASWSFSYPLQLRTFGTSIFTRRRTISFIPLASCYFCFATFRLLAGILLYRRQSYAVLLALGCIYQRSSADVHGAPKYAWGAPLQKGSQRCITNLSH